MVKKFTDPNPELGSGFPSLKSYTTNTEGAKSFGLNPDNHFKNPQRTAVAIRDLRFSYLDLFGNPVKHALNDLTLNVPKGQIYALLGPNGAGKTTLIKCMVARLKPTSGSISIFGTTPGSSDSQIPGVGVGYVPQELSLFLEFTIGESLLYFGKLYGLSTKVIENRTEFLLQFLKLPEKTRLLSKLSDGQRRRISMSIALIHSPPILILDEPTVGVDPLLRLSIWQHLEHLSRNCNITIMITTHYIEEASGASIIGFMRNGHILTEDSPKYLLKKHNTTSLEEVFLQICYSIDSNDNKHIKTNCVNNEKSYERTEDNSISDKTFYVYKKTNGFLVPSADKYADNQSDRVQLDRYFILYKYWALFFKNWIKLRGNIALVFFVLLLPSVEMFLFLLVTGPPHGLKVAVQSNETIADSFSSQLLKMLDKDSIIQVPYENLEKAIKSVESGQTTAVLSFSDNFTESLTDRLENKFMDDSNDTSADITGTVRVFADMSNMMMGPQIIEKLRSAVMAFLQHYFRSMGENPRAGEVPLTTNYIYGRFDPTFAEYALPGLMSFIMFYAPLKLCTFSMLKEREEGILERSLVAGVRVHDYLISHIVLQLISLVIQVLVFSVATFFVWGLAIKGSLLLLIVELLFHGLCSVSFGVLISSLVNSESAAMVIRVGVLLPSFFFSGIIWPIESYHPILQVLTFLSPLTLPAEAFRSILHRGWTLFHYPVWIAIVSNCIHSSIYLIIAVFASKVKIMA